MDKSKWVVNLSSRSLTEQEEAVLKKGMKFSPAPTVIPKLDYVVKVEPALSDHVEQEKAERARAAVSSVLRSVRNQDLMSQKRSGMPSQLCARIRVLLF